eukprot:TRINITY_DN8046_c0_g2_i1.p1 TRINITY_DN8046_c0_g2~~TRINITY_DN8046_c0_g2_i1.p1  ORF type:complete len:294 (+),score=42.64 TRINITY_DN8046_c0_g2_i1:244-1125(+)
MKASYTVLMEILKAGSGTVVCNPENYASVGGELLVLAMAVSWALTYFFDHQLIVDNELKKRVGYNNLCVGWDEAPAKLVAAPLFVLIIWANARYMQLDFWRASLSPTATTWTKTMVMIANMANALSWVACCLIFVVSPREDATLHTCSFVQLVVFGYIAYAANFLETEAKYHPRGSYVFLFFFGLTSLSFGVCAITQFLTYDEETQTPGPIPWYVTALCDYSWFACLGIQGNMRPAAPSLRVTYSLASDDDFVVLEGSETGISDMQALKECVAELEKEMAALRARLSGGHCEA